MKKKKMNDQNLLKYLLLNWKLISLLQSIPYISTCTFCLFVKVTPQET